MIFFSDNICTRNSQLCCSVNSSCGILQRNWNWASHIFSHFSQPDCPHSMLLCKFHRFAVIAACQCIHRFNAAEHFQFSFSFNKLERCFRTPICSHCLQRLGEPEVAWSSAPEIRCFGSSACQLCSLLCPWSFGFWNRCWSSWLAKAAFLWHSRCQCYANLLSLTLFGIISWVVDPC